MKKTIIESNDKDFPHIEEIYITKYYPEPKNCDETKKFPTRKRKLMIPREFNADKELNDRIEEKRNYYKCIEKFFNKTKEINNDDKEQEINNYLVDNEFLGKDLIGIQLLIPN